MIALDRRGRCALGGGWNFVLSAGACLGVAVGWSWLRRPLPRFGRALSTAARISEIRGLLAALGRNLSA